MKELIPLIALPAICATAYATSKPEWANREVFAVNRLPAHAFTHRFPSKETARPEPNWENPYHPDRYRMLNGTWKFNWSENPASAPTDFQKPGYNVQNWDDITVPLPWQIAGYGELYYFNPGHKQIPPRGNTTIRKQYEDTTHRACRLGLCRSWGCNTEPRA